LARLTKDRFTKQQQVFIDAMARTGDKVYSATVAGYAHPAHKSHALANDPKLRQAVLEHQLQKLTCEVLPDGINELHKTILDPMARHSDKTRATEAAAKLRASLETSLAAMTGGKSLHDMEPAALMQLASQLQAKADAIDAEPVPAGGIFD
jgi:hypothetical protein